MNSEDKRKVKIGIYISAFAIAFYFFLKNISNFKIYLDFFTEILSAFIIGVCFAFVLNLLMQFIEKKLFSKLDPKKHKKLLKRKRLISLTLTLLAFIGIVAALISFIIPQLAQSIKALVENVPGYIFSMQEFANQKLESFGVSEQANETITKQLTNISNYVVKIIGNAIPTIFGITKSITTGIINTLFGLVVGIYMLASKETILKNSKKMLYAFVNKRASDYITHIYRLIKDRFSCFVTGQLTEALIIGAIPGVLIMLMVQPSKAIVFIIFIIILQQIESNLIYPKIVGDSLGLPGLWVIFAISVGGALFNFVGVLLGVPVFAVIYTLISEATNKSLKKKGLTIT